MLKIFITAGEPSGDIHAAKLMKELRLMHGEVSFYGLGGSNMAAQGLSPIVPLSEIAVVGFSEVARKYLFFRELLRTCERTMKEEKIDIFIPVDYPGFNMLLAKSARQAGIPVAYYIAPQLWAWGQNRAVRLAKAVNKLLVVLPFEKEFFGNYGIDTEFVGHPLLDEPEFVKPLKPFGQREQRIAFMPGSRNQEVLGHCRIMKKTLEYAPELTRRYSIAMAVSPNLSTKIVQEIKSANPGWDYSANARQLLADSLAGVIKTGTSTLEAALLGLPFTMIYRASLLSYAIGRMKLSLPWVALPNILARKFIIKELIQGDATPSSIAGELFRLAEKESFETVQADFLSVRQSLGLPGASARAAEIITSLAR